MRRIALAVLLLAGGVAADAGAQGAARVTELGPGDVVRVHTGPISGTYRIAGVTRDSLRLVDVRDGAVHGVARGDVARGEVYLGPRPRGASMVEAAVVGLLFGAGAGALLGTMDDGGRGSTATLSSDSHRSNAVVAMSTLGVATGAVLGGLFPGERWRRLAPGAAVAVGVGTGAVRIEFRRAR
jgi:hypothetical protein